MRDGTQTRDKIERAALRLFAEVGIAETSIRDIARAAGVSQGAMYNHFKSKEVLAWHLFATNFSDIGGELRRIAREQPTLAARFHAMIRHVFERFDQDRLAVSYVFLVRHVHLDKVTPEMGNPYRVFRTVIAEAIRNGEAPRQDIDIACSLVVGAIIQVTDTRILGAIRGSLARHTAAVADACLRLLKA